MQMQGQQPMAGPHQPPGGIYTRRNGSSKPKKKTHQQPIKIIKNINNNNYIFNNPQIEIKNPQILGGTMVTGQQYYGPNDGKQGSHIRDDGGGITVIKENNHNIIMGSGGMPQTNMMIRRNADQNQAMINPHEIAGYADQYGKNNIQRVKSSGSMTKDQMGKKQNKQQFSAPGLIGQVMPGQQAFAMRNIQSQKQSNRQQSNNLMMSQQVVGSSGFGKLNQPFSNSQILNQQQLGFFKQGGPVKATALTNDQFANAQQISGSGVRRTMSGTSKNFKRGSGSLGPAPNQGAIRPGTASQKRPASPNSKTIVKQSLNFVPSNGPSPYSFMLGGHQMNQPQNIQNPLIGKTKVGQKPGSAPAKNQMR